MIVEGSAVFNINGQLYKLLLEELLSTPDPDNILHENPWMCLTLVELIAQSRLFAVIHYAVNLPIRWLLGNTHHIMSLDWLVISMSSAIHYVEQALTKI